jgi:hypothetical protein
MKIFQKKKLFWLSGIIILIGIGIIFFFLLTKKNPQSFSQKKFLPTNSQFKSEERDYNFSYLSLDDKSSFKFGHLILNNKKITWKDFIDLLKKKDKNFFKLFQQCLKRANSELNAYFWECPPITKNTLDKPFEFVVIKSEALQRQECW